MANVVTIHKSGTNKTLVLVAVKKRAGKMPIDYFQAGVQGSYVDYSVYKIRGKSKLAKYLAVTASASRRAPPGYFLMPVATISTRTHAATG
jgi:hypothetical protein